MPWGIVPYPSFAGGWKLTHLGWFFGSFWLPKHLPGTLVVSLTSACLDTNDSIYHQNSWGEETLVTAQNICNSVCYMGDRQKFKIVMKHIYGLSISQTLFVLKFEYESLLDDPNQLGTRRTHLHDHNSHCHIICHMTIWQRTLCLGLFFFLSRTNSRSRTSL